MRQVCRTFARSLSILTFVALAAGLVAAQGSRSRDLRLISARAGGINYVSGEARVLAAGETSWRALDTSHELASGDAVKTGAAGRLEVLLNPGSYLRVGEQTEFEMADTSLEGVRVRVVRGSVLVEAAGYDDLDPSITVATPQTEVAIMRSGIYRINVLAGGLTEVVVVKGRANVGGTVVKSDKVARVGAAGVEVAKYDKKRRDDLDQWSKERGDDLAEANRSFSRRTMRSLLADSRWDSLFYGGSRYDYSFMQGVWVYNSITRCYTFMPLSGGWRSPYGSFYNNPFFIPSVRNCIGCHGRGSGPIIDGRNTGGGNAGQPPVARPNFPAPPRQSPTGGGVRPTAAPPREHARPAAAERPAGHARGSATRRDQ
ncbi:MAG TPA: FecR domain-containing protein [Pyrinomonadaceae bacterium]|nr:FecR domain-containing protein [Pyrinomonadaceae bacterium]